jgi:hypothetical protein
MRREGIKLGDIDVAGYAGERARITAHRLAPESLQRARELLVGA